MRTCRPVAVLLTVVALTACGSPDPVAVRPAAGSAAPPVTVPPSTPNARASRAAARATTPPPAKPRVVATRPPAPTPPTPTVSRPPKPRVQPAEIALPAHDGSTPHAMLGPHTLVGSRSLGCVWVVRDGVRHAAIWPPGFRARFDPVRIYDAEHREVWREGQVMELGGGGGPYQKPVPQRCRTERTAYLANSFEPLL